MSDLPAGWEWSTIADVATVDSNLVAPAGHPDLPHIAPNHIESKTGRLLPYTTVASDGVKSPKHLFTPGHILYSKIRPYLAKATIVDFSGLCSADMYPMSTGLNVRYLLYWLLSAEFTALAAAQQGRSVLPKINQEALLKLLVPVPPLAEQHRIVAAVEQHLSRISAAEADLVASLHRLEGLEQRILDESLEGSDVPLRTLIREPLRNGLSAAASATGSIRVVTLTAVTRSEFIEANTKLIDQGSRSVDDLWMEPGDVFVQRSNTPELVGSAAMYRGSRSWAIFPDLLIRVRVNDRLDSAYLELVLQSRRLREYFRRSAQGIAGSMPKISQPVVEAAPIPIPSSVARQRSIVAETTQGLDSVRRVVSGVRHAQQRATALRRSILAAAFSGQLVPQDPGDEPASVLLERIRAEREAAGPVRRARRVKA